MEKSKNWPVLSLLCNGIIWHRVDIHGDGVINTYLRHPLLVDLVNIRI